MRTPASRQCLLCSLPLCRCVRRNRFATSEQTDGNPPLPPRNSREQTDTVPRDWPRDASSAKTIGGALVGFNVKETIILQTKPKCSCLPPLPHPSSSPSDIFPVLRQKNKYYSSPACCRLSTTVLTTEVIPSFRTHYLQYNTHTKKKKKNHAQRLEREGIDAILHHTLSRKVSNSQYFAEMLSRNSGRRMT